MTSTSKPTFLLDTEPLRVLCGYPAQGTAYIEQILQYANLALPEGVVAESRDRKIDAIVLPLIEAGQISVMTAPSGPELIDRAYETLLGTGERSVIKIALSTGLESVIDDKDAFIVANRFGVRPLVFHDFIVKLAYQYLLPAPLAAEIVTTTARQYPRTYLTYTLELLSRSR
jgi:hypothetical protein